VEHIAVENAQVAFLAEFAEKEYAIQLPKRSLAEAFGLTASHIRTIRAKARKKQKSPHRPLSLADDQEKAICEMVRERAIAGIYATQSESLNFVATEFRKTLTHGWLQCFLKRHSGDIRKALLMPQELPGLQISRCYLG
jgi:transposase